MRCLSSYPTSPWAPSYARCARQPQAALSAGVLCLFAHVCAVGDDIKRSEHAAPQHPTAATPYTRLPQPTPPHQQCHRVMTRPHPSPPVPSAITVSGQCAVHGQQQSSPHPSTHPSPNITPTSHTTSHPAITGGPPPRAPFTVHLPHAAEGAGVGRVTHSRQARGQRGGPGGASVG